MFLGRAKTPDLPDGTPGPDRVFLEGDADNVVRSLEAGIETEYFFIRTDQPATTLQPVTLKPGPRAPGRDLDVAEIIAGGVVVGSAEVER